VVGHITGGVGAVIGCGGVATVDCAGGVTEACCPLW
jgi:hypothetical protein